MQWFRNLRTMVKILFLVVSMTVLMLIIAWVGYSTSTRITLRMQDIFRNEVLSALNMTDAKALALENRLLVLSMMYTSSDAETEEYAKHFSENRAVVVKYAGELDPTRLEPEVRTLHTNLVALGQEYRKKQDEAVSAAKNGVQMDKIEARLLGDGDIAQMEDRYVDGLEKLSGALVKTAYSVNEAAADFARGRAVSIAATAFVAILIGLLLSVLISRMITSPIRRIMESVKVFATGDLVGGFPTRGKDELALMGQSLQGMSENLTRIIVSVKNASAQILDASQEFSALAQETSASIQESRANVDETGSNLMSLAAAGEEVNASVEEVAAGAQATAQKGTDIATRVEEAMKAGNDGMTSVKSVVSGIDGVVSNASSTVKSVQELSARSQQIQSFVTQIGGIADQTNLLALNAAIEAARAGDAGRGFAVVAEEVRKLAEESNTAAKSIEELAKTITGDLGIVVNMSLDNAKASENAKSLSQNTEKIIGDMLASLDKISGATQDLAAVSQQQAASSEEIAEAVQNIADKVQKAAKAGDNIRAGVGEVANTAEHMAARSENLSQLAGDLENLLEFFKLEESAAEAPGAKKQRPALRA